MDGFPKVVRKSYKVYDEMPWVEDDKRVLPVTNNLVYSYDYGDGWEVKITCTDGFYINDRYDDNQQYPLLNVCHVCHHSLPL